MSEEVWGIFFKVAQHLIAQESGGGWEDSDEESHSQVDVEDSDEEVKPVRIIAQFSSSFKECSFTNIFLGEEQQDPAFISMEEAEWRPRYHR